MLLQPEEIDLIDVLLRGSLIRRHVIIFSFLPPIENLHPSSGC